MATAVVFFELTSSVVETSRNFVSKCVFVVFRINLNCCKAELLVLRLQRTTCARTRTVNIPVYQHTRTTRPVQRTDACARPASSRPTPTSHAASVRCAQSLLLAVKKHSCSARAKRTLFSAKSAALYYVSALHVCISALQIIVGNTLYISACSTLGISQLSDRRREQCALMFRRIVSDQSHVLHYLLPAKRDSQLTKRLRAAKPYPSVRTRTTRFQNSFIPFSLTNFQWFNFECVSLFVCDCFSFNPADGCHINKLVLYGLFDFAEIWYRLFCMT